MKWNIDPNHTSVTFSVEYFGISFVNGSFRKFEGTVETDPSGVVRTISMRIEAASIDTNQQQRDGALRSEHFFDAERHPAIVVEGSIEGRSIGATVEMRGQRLTVTFPAFQVSGIITDPDGKKRIGGSAEATIDRTAWGISGNMTLPDGTPAIAMQVRVRIDAEAIEA